MNQQNDIMQLPISFGDDNKEQIAHSRGIQLANRNISENMLSGGQVMQKIASTSSEFQLGRKYPLQIITLELEDAPVPQQKQTEITCDSDYYTTNDISSYLVENESCLSVFNRLTDILINYSSDNKDMDVCIDSLNNCIEGIVFIGNYNYCIKFKINIWKQDANNTRFELVKTDGDALAAEKFFADIKTQFFMDKNEEKDVEKMNFVCLDLNASNLDLHLEELFTDDINMNMNSNIPKEELDEINKSLIYNDMCSIDDLQYLYERLCENNKIAKDIIGHKQLIKTIIKKSLKHQDICIVRGCLLILQQLDMNMNINNDELFINLTHLLKNNKYAFIKNYCVQLLANLSVKNINKNDANNIRNLLLKYENEWKNSILKNSQCINDNMFKQIYKKINYI